MKSRNYNGIAMQQTTNMEKTIQLELPLNLNAMFEGFVPERRRKVCNKCHKTKYLWEFGKDMRTEDCRSNTCRDCRRRGK